jgi:hypothetical protein
MIRLDNVSKQNGHQILFIEASTALYKGEKGAPFKRKSRYGGSRSC